jgi:hypothetical protein
MSGKVGTNQSTAATQITRRFRVTAAKSNCVGKMTCELLFLHQGMHRKMNDFGASAAQLFTPTWIFWRVIILDNQDPFTRIHS